MNPPHLVGMLHLPALPGTPAWRGQPLEEITRAACADAEVLAAAGFAAVMVQNSLDRPTRERVDLLCVAQLASVVIAVRHAVALSVGVNVVKNDGPAGVAVAAATGAAIVRVKVLTGAVLSAEGIVSGCAAEVQALRARCGARPAIWADIYEPTSRPLLDGDFEAAVEDAVNFGCADAVIVTGPTAQATLGLARKARETCPEVRVVIGGGVSAATVADALACADAVIIGRALKAVPGISGRVDMDAARAVVRAAAAANGGWAERQGHEPSQLPVEDRV